MNFLDSLVGSPATLRTYKSLFIHNILPYVSASQAKSFKMEDYFTLKKFWDSKHPRTHKMLIHLLDKYIKFHGGAFSSTQFTKAVSKSIPLSKVKALSSDDLNKVLNTAKETDPELYEIILFTVYTGMRRGEVFGLTFEDIDFKKGTVLVCNSYSSGVTKNSQPRVVQLPKKLKDSLEKRNSLVKNKRMNVFRTFDPNKRLKKICLKANVMPISIHALRHTFATLALDSKKSLKAVQTALGHKSLTTTVDIYWNKSQDVLDVDFI